VKGSKMDVDTRDATGQMVRQLDQILRELRLHNEREERRERQALEARAAARTRFAGL
jgi:hypothetical protein